MGLVQGWERSGLTMREFCTREGVKPATFSWWRQELKRLAGQKRATGRIELVEIGRGATSADTGFELALASGVRVRVPMRFEAEALKELLAVLASC